jgi:membrane protein DedA with SNARE-associated domain
MPWWFWTIVKGYCVASGVVILCLIAGVIAAFVYDRVTYGRWTGRDVPRSWWEDDDVH